jgi:hypothetical protein
MTNNLTIRYSMKKYWIIAIAWYSILLAIKFVFDIYSKQLFIAFYIIQQLCLCYVESSHLDELKEYKKINYPDFFKQKTGFMSTIYPFSILMEKIGYLLARI